MWYANACNNHDETEEVRNTENKLVQNGKSVELNINEDKTNYLIVSRI